MSAPIWGWSVIANSGGGWRVVFRGPESLTRQQFHDLAARGDDSLRLYDADGKPIESARGRAAG